MGSDPGAEPALQHPAIRTTLVVLTLAIALTAGPRFALGQPSSPPDDSAPTPGPAQAPSDPYQAYETGHYNQALQGFVDQQVRRPEDPEVALNVGSAHYEMGNFPEAQRAFAAAASDGDPDIRFQGLYNLGNTAFRQGKLDEAVAFYQAALEVNPDDEDAKFNLEYTRDEIRRRHEEAEKRQEEQEQQQQQGDPQQEGEGQESESQENSEGDEPSSGEEESGQDEGEPQDSGANQEEGQDQNPDQNQGQDPGADEQQAAGGPDADDDGLPDQVEREGANPTDPQNPDTDQDGLPDGAEDLDRDGEVDPGETDPNQADTDGDGIPDGQDPENAPAGQSATGQSATPTGEERPLTAEQAARLLDSLEEGRPVQQRPGSNRRTRPEKDW